MIIIHITSRNKLTSYLPLFQKWSNKSKFDCWMFLTLCETVFGLGTAEDGLSSACVRQSLQPHNFPSIPIVSKKIHFFALFSTTHLSQKSNRWTSHSRDPYKLHFERRVASPFHKAFCNTATISWLFTIYWVTTTTLLLWWMIPQLISCTDNK